MSTSTFSFCASGLTSTISPSKSESGPLVTLTDSPSEYSIVARARSPPAEVPVLRIRSTSGCESGTGFEPAPTNPVTPGVTAFVGAGAKPSPLSQPEVDRILHAGGAAGTPAARAQVEFSLGESVKVTSGPLSDFDGEIVDVNADAQKLKVLVDIFERQVPVELAFDQVKKID